MKKLLRLTAVGLTLCMLVSLLPAAGFAAEGTVHTVKHLGDPEAVINSAEVKDGDIIRLAGTGDVRYDDDAPWVIEKSVIIENGEIAIGAGGIVLGADVTFRNITLRFGSSVRNAIIANGHTLTLENVTCGNQSYNLFCGGLINSNGENFQTPVPGTEGKLVIKGTTGLQNRDDYGSGNIYAGNLTMGGMNAEHNGPDANGPVNKFSGSAVIDLTESTAGSTALGAVYACGAQQRIPVGQQAGKETTANAAAYTVSGTVTVKGKVPDVQGAGAPRVDVIYSGDGYEAVQTYKDISSLTVESGNLALAKGSFFRDTGGDVSVASGAKLNFCKLAGPLSVRNFQGGGLIILDEYQTLTVTGTVSGTAAVAVGYVSSDGQYSTKVPVLGHTYISAANSADGSFRLLPYANQTDVVLSRDSAGAWTATKTGESAEKVASVQFETTETGEADAEAKFPLSVSSASAGLIYLDFIPLNIYINERPAERRTEEYDDSEDIYYSYMTDDGMFMEVIANILYVTPTADGVYTIKLEVPGEYTASGQPLQTSTTLTVGDVSAPEHTHTWGAAWEKNSTHHWHECTTAGCPVTENSGKDGYAAHTAGDWVIEKPATATQAGSRYKACTVCGYEMSRETIPATGGSGSGGGSIGGGGGGTVVAPPAKEEETENKSETTVDASEVYADIPASAWYCEAVSFVTEKGLMSGTGTSAFAPSDGLTRAMLAQILYNNEEKPETGGSAFADVQNGAWYENAVTWATQEGIVSGYGDGQFGPNDHITREQFAVMLWRYAGQPVSNADLDGFTDIGNAGEYALAALRWAVEKGILSGKGNGTLDPMGNATRAEAAQMLMNYFR